MSTINKLRVVYSAQAKATPDQQLIQEAEVRWNRFKDNSTINMTATSSQMLIHAFQVLVKRGMIPADSIVFYNLATDPNLKFPILVDHKGTFSKEINGFCTTFQDLMLELLDD